MLRSNLVILHLTHTIYTNYYSSSYQLKYEYSLDQQQIELRSKRIKIWIKNKTASIYSNNYT